MMGVMRRMISYDSTGSFMMLACFPTELSNFLTIRPLNSQIYKHGALQIVASDRSYLI